MRNGLAQKIDGADIAERTKNEKIINIVKKYLV